MKECRIEFGSGLVWPLVETVEIEDWECAQDALDKVIDRLENEGADGLFVSQDEIENGEVYGDEYVIGGNHGLALRHYGQFIIKITNKGEGK